MNLEIHMIRVACHVQRRNSNIIIGGAAECKYMQLISFHTSLFLSLTTIHGFSDCRTEHLLKIIQPRLSTVQKMIYTSRCTHHMGIVLSSFNA